MPRKPESEKSSRGTALFAATFMAALVYGLGTLATTDPAWVADPTRWWMWLIAVPIVGLIYYQIRNNLS